MDIDIIVQDKKENLINLKSWRCQMEQNLIALVNYEKEKVWSKNIAT